MIEAYPLHWPVGYKRNNNRVRSRFQVTPDKAQQNLRNELWQLKASSIIISSNVSVRKDGSLYSDQLSAPLNDPGIAIYFKYKGKDVVMCCDKYERPFENIHALGLCIGGLRTIERHDVSEFLERAFTGFKALPETISKAWYQILGIDKLSNAFQIKEAYRRMAQAHHPDAGGSVEMFNKINVAYQQALASLKN